MDILIEFFHYLSLLLDGLTAFISSALAFSASFSGVCAAIATKLKPPKYTGIYSDFYWFVNYCGLNIGEAKNKNAPL